VVEVQRQPLQYVIVLDAGGSMSANFAGQCDRGPGGPLQAVVQCANGPDGSPAVQVSGTGINYYWSEPTERRFYLAKQALGRLVRRLNMPGNIGHDPSRPADQLAIVWFTHQAQGAGGGNYRDFSSDPATIIANLNSAGSYNGDPFRTNGGTNWGAGLYRASLGFAAAPTEVSYNSRTWAYERKVVLLTDSIANQFFDRTKANLHGGYSDMSTYPERHPCRVPNVVEIASCQITGDGIRGGGTYNGMDRPITQAVQVSQHELQAQGVEVHALAIASFPSTGLSDGVASTPSTYHAAPALELYPDGTNNVDKLVDTLPLGSESGTCTAVAAPGWATMVAPENQPEESVAEMKFPQVGIVVLEQIETGSSSSAPVIVDATTRSMSYSFRGRGPGAYRLMAAIFYRGEDQQTRRYGLIEMAGGEPQPEIRVELSSVEQVLDELSLRVVGDVCAAP
jgi:hypothetical protein